MNPTITSAAKLVIYAVAFLTGLWLVAVTVLVAVFDVAVQDAVLLGIMLDGPVMGLLALLANTRPSEPMVAAMTSPKSDPALEH